MVYVRPELDVMTTLLITASSPVDIILSINAKNLVLVNMVLPDISERPNRIR